MNNNQPKKTKHKNIKKPADKVAKSKINRKEDFSFQQDMVDLISDSQSVPPEIDENAENVEELPRMEEEPNVEKNIRFSNGDFILAIDLAKHYNVFVSHEHIGKAQIKTVFEKDKLNINGKKIQHLTAYHNFVFQAVVEEQGKQSLENLSSNFSKEDEKQLKKFLKGVNLDAQTLIFMNLPLRVSECEAPWLKLPSCTDGNDSLMILGSKNSGKSTLAEYLLNIHGQNCALLDCDIGRNSCMEGCISLTSGKVTKKIWIGEFSPLNNLQTYLRGIRYLFKHYRDCWFTRKLIVNTMGYTTGLGEFLLYEIYQIIQPKSIIVLQVPNPTSDSLKNIVHNIKTGSYISKLYMNTAEEVHSCSSRFHYYPNHHAFSKKSNTYRFQRQFQAEGMKINNVCDLLEMIREAKNPFNQRKTLSFRARNEINILEQSKHGKEDLQGMETVFYRSLSADESVDMRLIALGKMVEDNSFSDIGLKDKHQTVTYPLFQVCALGFCFQGWIYASSPLEGLIGVVNEGIDFEKKFYHLNQKQLIDLQLRMGRIGHLMVNTKGLGTKGIRNNPSKSVF